jgi:predicted DNA-binding helix-hairpin-helix protein
LEGRAPTPLVRQNRLYQSDFLLRFYGFTLQDLVFGEDGQLCDETDPKMSWVQKHPDYFPVEVNRASREQLLHVPGIGPRSAARILRLRRERTFCDLRDLRAVGAVASRAAPFILLDGRSAPSQLPLWEARSRVCRPTEGRERSSTEGLA